MLPPLSAPLRDNKLGEQRAMLTQLNAVDRNEVFKDRIPNKPVQTLGNVRTDSPSSDPFMVGP